MNELVIVECVTGHWCGERAALTTDGTCPICGSLVSEQTDEPVIVDGGRFDPLADTN